MEDVLRAARQLLATLDDVVPGWRAETLGPHPRADSVNAAWDALVAAVERCNAYAELAE